MNLSLSKFLEKLGLNSMPRARKAIVAIVGGTVFIFGIILIFLPGPSFLVIPAGLAILATEFVWARRWLQKFRTLAEKARAKFRRTGNSVAAQKSKSPSPPASTK